MKTRPVLAEKITSGNLTNEELFQNMVLRPIIKMQHDILILRFKNYLQTKKIAIQNLEPSTKALYIKQAFQHDVAIKKEMLGMVIGHLTVEEFEQYLKNIQSYNKRINQMICNRMLDSALALH